MVKNPLSNAGNARDLSSTPGYGRSSGGENGNQLQYSCLGNPMDRTALQTAVYGMAESNRIEQLSTIEMQHIAAMSPKAR